MAFADTAPLIALLKLDDKFSGPLKNAQRTLGQFDAKLSQTATRGFRAGQQIGTGIKNGLRIATVAFAGLTALLLQSAKEGQAAANVQKIYAQAIANSGKVSQAQVAILNAQQQALLNLAGVDDELIKTEQTRLIQMGLTGDQVAKLTPLILDLSKATGKDLLTVTLAVGKATLGNATALQRLGIVIPKTTAATKSAALASLELRQQQLKLAELNAKADGPLTKREKAYYAHAKAVLAADIAQQKLTDSQKKGAKTASDFDTTFGLLNKRFGGTTAALSGSLDVRLAVLRERLANVREEAGIRLLPVMTRIVDVVGRKLVPAFGDFIQAILPRALDGLNKLADFLDKGGATETLTTFLNTAKSVAPAIQKSAEITGKVISTAVSLFKSLPPEIQSLAIAGLAINKLTGGLVTNIAGGLISAVISSFKGMMNVNAAVVNVNGGVAGGLPGAASTAGGIGVGAVIGGTSTVVGLAALAAVAAYDRNAQEFINRGLTEAEIRAIKWARMDEQTRQQARNRGFGEQPNQAALLASAMAKLNPVIDRSMDSIEKLRGAVTFGTDATEANTAAVRTVAQTLADARAGISADRTARGLTGPFKRSTSLAPRFDFLRQAQSGSKDVSVANAIATGFERGATPLFRNTSLIPKSIHELRRDQRQLLKAGDTKNAALIGADIDRLKAVLRAKKLSVKTVTNVSVPVSVKQFINGRLIDAATHRFQSTIVGSRGTFAEFG